MRIRERLSYANVMATIAVFLALGGGAYALSLGRNSVGSPQLKPGAVKLKDTSASLRLKCPGGTRYFEGACIERNARSAVSWPDALTACNAARRRLPGPAELLGFARERGVTIGPAPDAEWAAALDSAPSDLQANGVTELAGDALLFTDPVGDAHEFRCVANAKR